MRFVLFLARKHLTYRRTQSLITVLGVAAGVMVLTTALSLTNGFTSALIHATLRAIPHISLFAFDPHNAPPPPPPAVQAPTPLPPPHNAPPPRHPEIQAQTPFLPAKVLLTRRAQTGRSAGADFATLLGVGEGAHTVYPGLGLEALESGRVVLGAALAEALGALPGDRLFAVSVNQRRHELVVAGTFTTGNYLIDSSFAFTTLEDVRTLLEMPSAIGGYHLRLEDPERAGAVARALTQSGVFWARTWQEANRTLIEQLALQKRVIGIVVFLIVVVAALGIANVLVLVVVEKTADIAILRVLGASAAQVAAVFALEGVLLGGLGVVLGDLLGLGLSHYFRLRPLEIPGELYFITRLPVEIRALDFAWVSALAFGTVLLASLLPLRRALRVKPGEVLR